MLEYLLLLTASLLLIIGSFTGSKSPVKMFELSGPVLATRIEQRLITGQGFSSSRGDGNTLDWER